MYIFDIEATLHIKANSRGEAEMLSRKMRNILTQNFKELTSMTIPNDVNANGKDVLIGIGYHLGGGGQDDSDS